MLSLAHFSVVFDDNYIITIDYHTYITLLVTFSKLLGGTCLLDKLWANGLLKYLRIKQVNFNKTSGGPHLSECDKAFH